MSLDFENKNILVIGGSSGIGRGIAESFIKYKANVAITGTRSSIEDYDEKISENLKKCVYKKLDLSSHENLNSLDIPFKICLLYTSPSPRDATLSRMPSSA